MLKLAIVMMWILSAACLLTPSYTASYQAKEEEPTLTPTEYIKLYAERYGASEHDLLAVAVCESKLNPDAINYNDGGKGKHSVGLFQYQESTFRNWSKKYGEELDYYSYHDQAKLAAQMFRDKQQKHWTCYRKIYKV